MAEAPGDSGESDYEPVSFRICLYIFVLFSFILQAEVLEDESPNDVIEEDHEYLRHHIATLKMDDAVLEPGILKTFEESVILNNEWVGTYMYGVCT